MLQIGECRVDPAANEVGRAGKTVRIEPKAMRVLEVLAGRPGAVVGREELLCLVWPGMVVGDEALTQTIIKLRKALGDDPRSPAYIETISKRGYRLVAPVREAGAMPAAAPRRRATLFVALGAALAAAGLALWPRAPETVDPGAQQQAEPLTVTVLPFEALGGEREQAYLARGISEDLMTDLSRLPELRLIRAPSAAQVDGRARYRVSGSVQRMAGTLRVNIHLVDAETSQQLWSERFERPAGDLFKVQDEIARRLAELLPAKLSAAARQRLAKRYTRSLEAYDHFLRGQALFLVRRVQDNEEARDHYRKALEVDPKFARAYAGLAMTYALEYRLRPSGASSPVLARAYELAETARLMDPEIPEVHWALGFVHVQGRRHEQAIQSLRRAIEMNRSFADAYALLGGIHTYTGEPARAIPMLRTAMRLNPDAGYLYFQILGRAYLLENDPEQALINLREAFARNPADLETRVLLAAALTAAGDTHAAEWETEEIRSLEAGFSARSWLETYPLVSARDREKLAGLLARAGL